ncbi:MAG: deoxynucleoside kinase [Fusobacteriaceae bacterium]
MYYKDFFEKLKIGGIKMRTVICIDGVVGVGKSTVGDLLAQELNTRLFVEPVIDNPLLDKFYYDRKQYAFPLQVFFLNKRFEMIKDAEKFESCIMDRSIYGDVIFARMLMEDGDMSSDEFKIYEELLTHMLEHIELPKLMIYLETTVENAIDKIKRRGRDYEQIVPREYWQSLNKNYSSYFKSYNLSDILVVNVDNLDIRDNLEDREYFFNLVKEKLAEIDNRK